MPITTLDPENSVLFLGSGFSTGSTNIAQEKVPTGHPLLDKLATALDEDPQELDLKSAADEFLSRNDSSLYDLLYETFTITETLAYQRDVLTLPWSRIYTTNYDDIINHVKGPLFPIFTFDDLRPRRLPPAFAVHLHGSIRRANADNASEQLVLNNRSYDTIAHTYPDWFQEFQRDRRTFAACFFMGFSLADHHISGLMAAGEESARRTFFIARSNPKASFSRRAGEYGEVVPIEIADFVTLASTLPKPEKPADLDSLQSFKHLRPGLDSKRQTDPTPVEIINLVSFGTFSQSRFFNTTAPGTYLASRTGVVRATLSLLKGAKTVLIHSRLGNGKTLFTSILALAGSAEGYTCLLWRRAGRQLAQDLDIISPHKKVIVIFDDYDAAIEYSGRILAGAPDVKFVVTVRTGQQEVRFHEILEKLPTPVKRVDLNSFDGDDRRELLSILSRAGAYADDLKNIVISSKDIRDVVTKLYDHQEIRSKINGIIASSSSTLSKIVAYACLIKWAGVDVDDSYIQELAGLDIYAEIRRSGDFSSDFLDAKDDRVEMRSGFLSEYFIQKIFDPRMILSCCYDIVTSATRKKIDRGYRRLAAELIKFSTLQKFLKFHGNSDELISSQYEKLARDHDVNAEPLFWLQYAIFMKNIGDIVNARRFLKTGYERASDIEGFKTFQLDTQALSIYLAEEALSSNPTVEGLDGIIEALRTVTDMISDDSHRYHAIDVVGEVPKFVDTRKDALKDAERVALVFELNRASKALGSLTADDQVYTGSAIVRSKLEAAIAALVS